MAFRTMRRTAASVTASSAREGVAAFCPLAGRRASAGVAAQQQSVLPAAGRRACSSRSRSLAVTPVAQAAATVVSASAPAATGLAINLKGEAPEDEESAPACGAEPSPQPPRRWCRARRQARLHRRRGRRPGAQQLALVEIRNAHTGERLQQLVSARSYKIAVPPPASALQGFGWAIAKALAEAGADISLGVWVSALHAALCTQRGTRRQRCCGNSA